MDAQSWNSLISTLPEPHILQTWEWGDVKCHYGWAPIHAIWYEKPDGRFVFTIDQQVEGATVRAAALILKRTIHIRGLSTGLTMLYVPKGPLLSDWTNSALRRLALNDLSKVVRQAKAIFIKVDPDVRLGTGIPGQANEWSDQHGDSIVDDFKSMGWQYSNEQVQFANTVLIDLSQTKDELLARMKPKTRYNIRLAERRGVKVRPGNANDLDLLYQLYAETSVRDGFVIRSKDYYYSLWNTFLETAMAKILIAEVDEYPVSALILFLFQRKAWFLYGMSRDAHREKMPNYLLQWEAICECMGAGCLTYDLWGAPNQFVESDPLWGVYRFKDGLGGQVVRHIGAWDFPVQKTGYRLVTQILPGVLNRMRSRGVARTQQSLAENL
jgi:peptidoglycan pentaglycine glycine transferase (the first glycine)